MNNNQSNSRKIYYSTTILFYTKDNQRVPLGTGFFFNFKGEKNIPVLVTNKHVIKATPGQEIEFSLRLKTSNSHQKEQHIITQQSKWHYHSDPNVDLACLNLKNLVDDINHVKHAFLNEDLIWNNEALLKLSGTEEVSMIGYPRGYYDKINNLPIHLKGYLASLPHVDYNGNAESLVNISSFQGSSGSPIFIIDEMGYVDENGDIRLGQKRLIFLGIFSSAYNYNETSEVKFRKNKKNLIFEGQEEEKGFVETRHMMNLGFYIKAIKILDFKKIIEE